MKFPEKYIKRGKTVLHSGGESDIFYDVNALLTDDFYTAKIIENIPFGKHYVGIATGGAILGRLVSSKRNSKFSIVKDNELKGEIPSENYILIDDVTTTENSLNEAIRIIGKKPWKIFIVVDRRKDNKNLEVQSLFKK